MKHLLTIFFLTLTAHATTVLDARTNVYNFTNSISVGSVTVSNQINTTISSGAVAIAGGAFTGAVFNPQTVLAGVSNVSLLGGLGGGITDNVLTVDGAAAAIASNTAIVGTYIAEVKDGTITWKPVANLTGTNLYATAYTSPYAVTNIFTNQGRTTQTWTWTGGTTNIMIKAWGGGGGTSFGVNNNGGNAGYVMVVMSVTNNMVLSLLVGNGGGYIRTQYVSEVSLSWPGGGVYNTNSTYDRSAGGGCSIIYYGTNLILVAAGGGSSIRNGQPGNGGWPSGYGGAGSTGGGGNGTQTSGGASGGGSGSEAGSYLQGGNTTLSTNITQVCGGCGYYGGGSKTINDVANMYGGGGSSYFNSSSVLFGYATASLNSGDVNYSSYGIGSTIGGGVGGNGGSGAILIITPTP